MEDQILISIPNQIIDSTKILSIKPLCFIHREKSDGGDQTDPKDLELAVNDYLKITSSGSNFMITLPEGIYNQSGDKLITEENSLFIHVVNKIPEDNSSIEYDCRTCKKEPGEARKKIIVRNVGETVEERLGRLLNNIRQIETIISKRINKS